MVYIGIDVGGTGIKIGLVNEEGQLIHQGETPTLVGRPYQEIIADMGHCALKVLDEAKLTVDDVHSVGIGIPGIADAKTGNVIFCTNMGWKDVPLRSELQKYINKPVFIDNDATVRGAASTAWAARSATFPWTSAACPAPAATKAAWSATAAPRPSSVWASRSCSSTPKA